MNADKCKVMHVGRKNCKEIPYSIGQGIGRATDS